MDVLPPVPPAPDHRRDRPRGSSPSWPPGGSSRPNGQAKSVKKDKKEDGPTAAPVELTTVGKGDDLDVPRDHDRARGGEHARCWSPAGRARSSRCSPRRGRTSRSGQPLAKLDDTEARIALGRAQAMYDQAKRDAERGTKLEQRGLQSAQAMDDLKLKLEHREAEPGAGAVRPGADADRGAVRAARW